MEQINKVIIDNIVKNEFKANSSLKINDYILDKNEKYIAIFFCTFLLFQSKLIFAGGGQYALC